MKIEINDIVKLIAKRQHQYHLEMDEAINGEVDETYDQRCHTAGGKWIGMVDLMDDIRAIHMRHVDDVIKGTTKDE